MKTKILLESAIVVIIIVTLGVREYGVLKYSNDKDDATNNNLVELTPQSGLLMEKARYSINAPFNGITIITIKSLFLFTISPLLKI